MPPETRKAACDSLRSRGRWLYDGWEAHRLALTLMPNASESRVPGSAFNGKEREAILAERQYIVSHPSFNKSRRCVDLFQHIIDRALDNDQDSLKERILGVEVFGRNPNYDTNADPIVRMTANEIRKRLALCYQEGDHGSSVRIHLIPGSYCPQFELAGDRETLELSNEKEQVLLHAVPARDNAEPVETPPEAGRHEISVRRRLLWVCVCLVLCGAVLGGWLFLAPQSRSTQELIWAPLLQGHQPVMVCVFDKMSSSNPPVNSTWADVVAKIIATHEIPASMQGDTHIPTMHFVDAQAAGHVLATIAVLHGEAYMRGVSTIALSDLRRGPNVLIGAFDNPWSLMLLSHLRFHVMVDPATQAEWIEDTQSPAQRKWVGTGLIPFVDSSVDYAVITRVRSPETGTWIMAIGGLGLHGTEAGSELITDPNLSKVLPSSLRDTQKNFQIVIKTTVIDGSTGPPQVVATYVW